MKSGRRFDFVKTLHQNLRGDAPANRQPRFIVKEPNVENARNKVIANKYNRIASLYDIVDWFIPSRWRRQAAGLACGRVLEVGVGTGLNLPFYTDCCTEILGIDISAGMLEKVKERIALCRVPVRLDVMDVQSMPLDSDSFDSVLAAFVFCTVSQPIVGLRECYRVLRPGGKLIMIEHMGSNNRLSRPIMDWLNPLTVKLLGDHINRDTAKEVASIGFKMELEENLLGDIVRLIVAEKYIPSQRI